jgi:hypothetical protein
MRSLDSNIQFAFFVMWRRLFAGWDFSELTLGEVAQYCQKKVPKPAREFFHVFCMTQSFDQYCLRVKGFVLNRPRSLPSILSASQQIPNTSTSSSALTSTTTTASTTTNSSETAATNLNQSVNFLPSLVNTNQANGSEAVSSDSPTAATPTSNISISQNVNKPTNSLNQSQPISVLKESSSDLKSSDYFPSKNESKIESNTKAVFQEYKNTVHAYECVHALLTEGMFENDEKKMERILLFAFFGLFFYSLSLFYLFFIYFYFFYYFYLFFC